jgi:putative restriction endonuclease
VKIFVANTDVRWYRFLADRNQTSEVNFWRPSGAHTAFRAIQPGEPFFFRLGKPINKIAGFGIYTHHLVLKLAAAWDIFGEANGAESREQLAQLIGSHRSQPAELRASPSWEIGCTILTGVHYYPESDWLDFRFPPGLMQGKSMEVTSPDGALIWNHMNDVSERAAILAEAEQLLRGGFQPIKEASTVYSVAQRKDREGQGAFRAMVLDAYGWRCCVTGERTVPVVDAAHIQPYISPKSNHVQNGLPLREDVHTLFDAGYVAVDERYRFIVSDRLKGDFENGREYYKLRGKEILLPRQSQLAPSKEAIRWHLDNVFIG